MAFRNYLEGEDDKPYFHLNSLAHYYEEMQRYAALIKEMTGYIKDYGNELGLTKEEIDARLTAYILQNKAQLDQRLGEWDEKLQQFDGSVTDLLAEWVDDGTLNHIIDTTLIDQKIEPLTKQLTDFNKMSQSPKPPKSGRSSSSPKLAIKTGNDAFLIIQNMGKGYVAHTLNTTGGTTEASHGVNWDLLRLKKSQHVSDAYMAYDNHQNVVGTLTQSVPGAKIGDIVDTNLTDYNAVKSDSVSIKSNKAGDIGLTLYHLDDPVVPSSVSYIIKTGKARKANAMIYGNATGSQDIDILVNGQVVVKGVNSRMFRSYGDTPGRNLIGLVEFDIPVLTSQAERDIKITLRNNSLTDRMYFFGINFTKVKDHVGEYVNFYKILPNTLKWIDAVGASDYAIREKNGLWFGSYHGGEVRESGKMPWKNANSSFIRSSSDISLVDFSVIPIGEWVVLDDLSITQRTNLINKAKMLSNWNFDEDGTFNMSFGWYDNTIVTDLMYTSLTCTHTDFLYVTYPRTLLMVPGTGNVFDIVEGKVTQRSASRGADLTIRFSKFNDFFSDKRVIVNSNASYNKLYYSPISQISGGIAPPNFSFEKSLDFSVD